jgi:hypothetical protein
MSYITAGSSFPFFPWPTYAIEVTGKPRAVLIAAQLVLRNAWFMVTPLPDKGAFAGSVALPEDKFRATVREENAALLDSLAIL